MSADSDPQHQPELRQALVELRQALQALDDDRLRPLAQQLQRNGPVDSAAARRQIQQVQEQVEDLALGQRQLFRQIAFLADVVEARLPPLQDPGPIMADAIQEPATKRWLRRAWQLANRARNALAWRLRNATTPAQVVAETAPARASGWPQIHIVVPLPAGQTIGESEVEAQLLAACAAQSYSKIEIVLVEGLDEGQRGIGNLKLRAVDPLGHSLRELEVPDHLLALQQALPGYILAPVEALPQLPLGALESAALTLVSESLPLLELDLRGFGPNRQKPVRHAYLVAARYWHPKQGVDFEPSKGPPLASRRLPILGKTVRVRASAQSPPQPRSQLALPSRARAVGPYLLFDRARGPQPHPLHDLGRLAEPAAASAASGSRSRAPQASALVLLAAPLACGRDRLLAQLLSRLDGALQLVVVPTVPQSSLGLRRLQQLEQTGARVLPLAEMLHPEALPTAILHLARRPGMCVVLRFGTSAEDRLLRALRQAMDTGWDQLPCIDHPAEVGSACPEASHALIHVMGKQEGPGTRAVPGQGATHGADGPEGSEVPKSSGAPEVHFVSCGPDLEQNHPSPAEPGTTQGADPSPPQAALRQRLGIPSDAVMVLMQEDLIAESRPEDLVNAAHHLHQMRSNTARGEHPQDDNQGVGNGGSDAVYLVIAGQGPLAGALRDLNRYLEAPNLVLVDDESLLSEELRSAADLMCFPGESHGFPRALALSLADGIPLVAAEGAYLGALGEESGVIRYSAGNVAALAAVLHRLRDGEQRQALAAAARQGARLLSGQAWALAYERLLGLDFGSAGRS